MPRMQDEAREDETITRSFHLEKPAGGSLALRVTFYPNRLDWSPPPATELPGYSSDLSDEEVVALRSCAELEHIMQSWDMVGPYSVNGEQVAGEDEMIPLTVPVLRAVKPWITIQLSEKIKEAVLPNLRRSRDSRKRG